MTGEEMERAIEFVLQSQARLEGQIAETNRVVQLHAETQIEFIGTVTRGLEGLTAAQAQTDARLDRLVATVERLAERVG